MTVVTFLLMLLCTAAWSLLDMLRKVLGRELSAVALALLLTLPQVVLFLVLAWWGRNGLNLSPPYFAYFSLLIPLNVVALVLLNRAVVISGLSYTIPYLSLTPAFAVLAALPLGERPSVVQFIGVAVIVVGGVFLHSPAGSSPKIALQALFSDRGSMFAVSVAALWGGALVFDKQALSHSGVTVHGLLMSAALSAVFLVILIGQGRTREVLNVRRCGAAYLLSVAAACTGYFLQLELIQDVDVGVFEATKRSLGVVLAVLNGYIFFDEGLTRRKVASCFLMAIGVTAVVLF